MRFALTAGQQSAHLGSQFAETRLLKQRPHRALDAPMRADAGGDLGGGYFPGAVPALQWDAGAALVYGGLGLLAALVGWFVVAPLNEALDRSA